MAFGKRIHSKICIRSCFVSLESVLFNILCIFDLLFFLLQKAGSQLCFRFFFFGGHVNSKRNYAVVVSVSSVLDSRKMAEQTARRQGRV